MVDWLRDELGAWERADWLSFGQLVFTALAFLIALPKISRVATASEQTNEKLDRLQFRILNNDLLVILPELHRLEDEVDDLQNRPGQERQLQRGLVAYARLASQVQSMLESRSETAGEPIIRLLVQAAKASTRAKAEIAQGPTVGISDLMAPASEKMTKVSLEVSALMARLQRKVETNGSD